jgi:hypothetical protein
MHLEIRKESVKSLPEEPPGYLPIKIYRGNVTSFRIYRLGENLRARKTTPTLNICKHVKKIYRNVTFLSFFFFFGSMGAQTQYFVLAKKKKSLQGLYSESFGGFWYWV